MRYKIAVALNAFVDQVLSILAALLPPLSSHFVIYRAQSLSYVC